LPRYRYGPAAAPLNNLIYLIGGTGLVNGQGPIYPIAVYDPNTDSWSTNVPANPATTAAGTAGQPLAPLPTGRWGFDVAVIDGVIYAVGGAVHVPGNISKTEATVTKIAGATSGTPIALNNWEHYYFFVTAIDAATGIESAPSHGVSALLRAQWAAGDGSSAGNGQATLTWREVTGATSYNVYYSTRSGVTPANPVKLSVAPTATIVSSTVTGLANGTPYYFLVTAVTAAGEVEALSEVSVTPQATPAANVPANVAVTSGNAQATLTWSPVANAASYNVYYGTGANIYYGTVEAYDPVANTWTTKASMPTPRWGATVSVVNGLVYAIGGWAGWPELALVEVYDPATNSWSTTVPVTGATTAAGTAGAALAPMPTARDDFGFSVVNGIIYAIGGDINAFNDVTRVSCCTTAVEAYDPVTNTWTTKTAMPTIRDDFDASMVDGVIYAIAGSRDGMFTNTGTLDPVWLAANNGGFSLTTVEAFSLSSIPAPNGVAVSAGANQATLNWNAVTGATSYNIYWSNKAGVSTTANSTKIASVTPPYIHTGLTPGNWHYYIVTAVTAAGESLPSNEVAVKP
jgi:fibronectin type 3 domain-containing protein